MVLMYYSKSRFDIMFVMKNRNLLCYDNEPAYVSLAIKPRFRRFSEINQDFEDRVGRH